MKPSLALSVEPALAKARRLLGLSTWLLFAPMGAYLTWLNWGHTLGLLQMALLAVSVVGLGVVNGETAVVVYNRWGRQDHRVRGLLQRLWGKSVTAVPVPKRSVDTPSLVTASSTLSRSAPLALESFRSQRLRPAPPTPLTSATMPFASVIVVAYLPNEQEIIEETLLHWLTQVTPPASGWELVLAYNTPTRLPVEACLKNLADRFPQLVLLPVGHSQSKAENLNAALKQVQGEMTCIFDADHHPNPDCLSRAWEWLAEGQYDGVQGRNIIRNAGDNWLTNLIAVEFECIYGVSHYGRSLLADTALFGGSNGYWRTAAIQHLGFEPARLTEDIDATLRGLLEGYRIVHDPAIVTTELAPNRLRGLWLQRQRWSQGWVEVGWLYMGRVVRSPYLDPIQKIYWVMMLLFSQGFYPLVWQVVPMLLSIHVSGVDRDLHFETLNLTMMGLLTLSVVIQVVVAMRLRPANSSYSRRHGGLYCLLSPVYFWLKTLIGLVALYNHLCGSRAWHVTARTKHRPKKWVLGLRDSE
ncbi:MAG: glycosyltransferase family 2 protein [Nodosilinea sp.]